MADRIQLRRDTAANWTSANPTLAQGEIGIELDTLKLKIGDGVTAWSSLAYYQTSSATGTVESVALSVPTGLEVSGSPITTTGTFTVTYAAGYSIPTTTKQSQWDTAYSWGNHAAAGYLTSESDPIFVGSDVYGVTSADISNWDTAYSWGNHASAGYLTSDAIGDTVQPYDSTILKSSDIGVTVQAYDADTAKTDENQTFSKAQRGSITTLTDAAIIDSDFSDSNFFTVTLTDNRTLGNPSNLVAGQSGSIFIVQDGSGSHALAFDTYWHFAGGVAPSLSTDANAVDRLDYVVRSSTSIHAVLTRDVK